MGSEPLRDGDLGFEEVGIYDLSDNGCSHFLENMEYHDGRRKEVWERCVTGLGFRSFITCAYELVLEYVLA
jgi:hypothetical protein